LRRLGAGRTDLELHHDEQAVRELAAAEQDLRALRSFAVSLVRFHLAVCRFEQGDSPAARAALERLGQDRGLAEYPSLEARRQAMLGLIAQRPGKPTDALAALGGALRLLEAAGDDGGIGWIENLIAESLDSLGQPAEAWGHRSRALAVAGTQAVSPLFYGVVDGAVTAALLQKRPRVALDFQDALVRIAENLGRPEEIALTLLRRARICAALGRSGEATAAVDHAAAGLLAVEDADARSLVAAEIDVVRSEVGGSENPAAAVAALSRALALQQRRGIESLVPELLGARADSEIRLGHADAAESDFERALDEIEGQRAQMAAGSYRISFLDQAQSLYERAASLQLRRGNAADALDLVERSRARALLDRVGEMSRPGVRGDTSLPSAAPLGSAEICRRLPPRTVVAVYAVLDGRLVTWLLRPGGVELSRQQPPWQTVAGLVRGLRAALAGGDSRVVRRPLEQLDQLLVEPWRVMLRSHDRIVFVPTRTLYEVPFAALRDRRSGRFLVEDHAIGVAPSASEMVEAAERDGQAAAARPLSSILLVGDPALGGGREVGASPLPGAAREVEQLAGIYRGLDPQVLQHAQATEPRVLAALLGSDVAHLAMHGVEGRRDPSRSRLLLAREHGRPGELAASTILRLRLRRTRVVVLAACDTQAGRVSASEGALSIAAAFLAAGVPAVMGSLWAVEDESTARVSVRFHRELVGGADALEALRAAQLAELATQAGKAEWTWASFEVLGGVAPRERRADFSLRPVPEGRSRGELEPRQ
jgi:CHAT domain-containing protein/tetratricopeptide (TPR) repeat protein